MIGRFLKIFVPSTVLQTISSSQTYCISVFLIIQWEQQEQKFSLLLYMLTSFPAAAN